MNALDLFAEFDVILINRIAEISSASEDLRLKRKNFYLKDLSYDSNGKFLPHLNSFLCWLIEDIDRETYFSKHCDIRFFHIHEDVELIKVSLSPSSRCTVHILKQCEKWVKDCEIAWMLHRNVVRQKFMPESYKSVSYDSIFTNLMPRKAMKKPPPHPSGTVSTQNSMQLLSSRYSSTSAKGDHLLSNSRTFESKRFHCNRESSKLEYSQSTDYLVLSDLSKEDLLLSSIDENSYQSDESEQSVSDSSSIAQSVGVSEPNIPIDLVKLSATDGQPECGSVKEETNASTTNSVVDSATDREEGSSNKDRADLAKRWLSSPAKDKNCITVKLSTLPTDTSKLCQLFRIKSASIFSGVFLEKKFGGEFLFKKRFMWCDPSTRSILWAKSAEMRHKNPSACKFVLLKRFLSRKSISAGQCRGIVHHISFNEHGFNILTESGTHMAVKLPSEVQACWQKLLLILHT